MPTKYNIEIAPENYTGMPEELYSISVEQLKKTGLLGRKHISHIGRAREGYDADCDVYCHGAFHLFYRDGMDFTAREAIEGLKLTTSGFDEKRMRTMEMAEEAVDILEKAEPAASVLPWENYSQMPLIESMEIDLACGKQLTYVYSRDGGVFGIIQFWKPSADKYWYDFDTLKNFLYEAVMEDMTSEITDLNVSPVMRVLRYLKKCKLDGRMKLQKRIINPDSIKKIRLRD